MSFTGFLVLVLVVVILFSLLGAFFDGPGYGEVVTTTTTYDVPADQPNIVGNLKRRFTEGDHPQAFVIDPVDGEEFFLNTNDDMYEDADGKVWRLV